MSHSVAVGTAREQYLIETRGRGVERKRLRLNTGFREKIRRAAHSARKCHSMGNLILMNQ